MYDWSDVKFFLAVARGGSTLAASRLLGVNQTTVVRRIEALEDALNARLFNRNQDGYRLSEAGAALLAQAERVATEAETLQRLAAQRSRDLSGVIRVTTMESVANIFLTPMLAEFIELYPDIKVELIATDQRLDLARGDADIAIRASHMPTDPGIVVRKLADDPWAVFCSRIYAEKRGIPKCGEDLNDHSVIGAEGFLTRLDAFVWLTKAAPRATVRSVCSTVVNALAAVRAGHGVGPLPRCATRIATDLVECFALPKFDIGYFLLTREDMKDLPRVKVFTEFIVARMGAFRPFLEGQPEKERAVRESARHP